MPKACYFYRRDKDVRVLMNVANWSARNLKAKGFLTSLHFITREMTDRERDYYHDAKREHYEIYTNWSDLIKDDIFCEVPDSFIKIILEFARSHPLQGESNV